MAVQRKKILVTILPLGDEQVNALRAQADDGYDLVYKRTGVTESDVADASIIVGSVDPRLLAHAPKLEWLQLSTAGADPYLKPGVFPAGCALTTATGAYGLAVSEHMLALTFALLRRLNQYIGQQGEGAWRSLGDVKSVEGSTVLVMGLGNIGGDYARKVNALGAHVIGLRRHVGEKPDYIDELHTNADLDNLLPRADIVAMVLPGGPETAHIMDERRLRLMKRGAYIINVGRGSAIEPNALKKVLREGYLAGAALDVTEPEPLPADDELWRMKNVIITPHVAGHFFLHETVNRIAKIAGENLRAWTRGEALRNRVKI